MEKNNSKQTRKGNEVKALFDTPNKQNESEIEGALCYVRGRVYEHLDNRERAIFWYKKALEKDVYCYEAFERLVGGHMLSGIEEITLLSRFSSSTSTPTWLKEYYGLQMNRYQRPLPLAQEVSKLCLTIESTRDNAESLRSFADLFYHHNRFHEAYEITSKILEVDPFNFDNKVYSLHLSCLVELGKKTDLFYLAHKLVEDDAETAIGQYAVGCYYYLIGKFDSSRNFFRKATTIDPHFGEAWIAFAHSFSAQGEHDQSMAAYRNASRMLTGCHLPSLCIGMEYIRLNNFSLASKFLLSAKEICSFDPLLYNELGCIAYKEQNWQEAADHFTTVLKIVDENDSNTFQACWEPTIFNLGHCYRKLQMYEKALEKYQLALSISPMSYSIYSAIGFTYHLLNEMDLAMDFYHRALGINSRDTFSSDMLKKAMEEYDCNLEKEIPRMTMDEVDL